MSPLHMIQIRPVAPADGDAWARMRGALWPDDAESGHRREITRFFAHELREPLEVLVAADAAGALVGFAELSIREHAVDCVTDRVAYLEGWYVHPDSRRRGVGRALIQAAEAWARAQGCAEFASDARLDNDVSAAAHSALGFHETARLRCFRKVVDSSKLPAET